MRNRNPAACSVVCAVPMSCVVTSGTADVDGPFETETVTVDPREPSDPPLGVWRVTMPAAWSESSSMRDTTKPARCSSEAAWSWEGLTFGTFTGRGPFDTLTRTCVPSTTTVPAPATAPSRCLPPDRVDLDDLRDPAPNA